MKKRDKTNFRFIILNFLIVILIIIQAPLILSSQESTNLSLMGMSSRISGGSGAGGQAVSTSINEIVGVGSKRIPSEERINRDKIIRKSGSNESIIDPDIESEFEKEGVEELRLIVNLNDTSKILIKGNKEERREKINQIDDWFKPEIDTVLGDYSGEDFHLIKKRSRGFVADVTKKGYEKLVKDHRVSEIYIDRPISASLSSSVPHINADDV